MSEQTNHNPAADPAAGGAPGQELPATDGTPETAPDAGVPAGEPVPDAADTAPPAAETTIPAGDAASAEAAAEAQAERAGAGEPDYKDLYLRARADMENVRKRARRDVGAAEARGIGRLAKELLPALDNFDRALAAAEAEEGDGEHHLTKGIRLVQQELVGALTRVGIEVESPHGEPFDPHRHEALAQHPVEGTEAGTIVEVWQPGYRYQETILRPAKVVVSS
jgi:molecular chaperone GrpE